MLTTISRSWQHMGKWPLQHWKLNEVCKQGDNDPAGNDISWLSSGGGGGWGGLYICIFSCPDFIHSWVINLIWLFPRVGKYNGIVLFCWYSVYIYFIGEQLRAL